MPYSIDGIDYDDAREVYDNYPDWRAFLESLTRQGWDLRTCATYYAGCSRENGGADVPPADTLALIDALVIATEAITEQEADHRYSEPVHRGQQ